MKISFLLLILASSAVVQAQDLRERLLAKRTYVPKDDSDLTAEFAAPATGHDDEDKIESETPTGHHHERQIEDQLEILKQDGKDVLVDGDNGQEQDENDNYDDLYYDAYYDDIDFDAYYDDEFYDDDDDFTAERETASDAIDIFSFLDDKLAEFEALNNGEKDPMGNDQVRDKVLFDQWLKMYNKTCIADTDECKNMKQMFEINARRVFDHNARYYLGQESYKMALNHLAGKYVGQIKEELGLWHYFSEQGADYPGVVEAERLELPAEESDYEVNFDWSRRPFDCITPVKEQGNCSASYAFASIGALEAHYCLATGQLFSFSEQQILDCTQEQPYHTNGCNGGNIYAAFQYAGSFRRLCSSNDVVYRTSANRDECAQHRCSDFRYTRLDYPYYVKVPKRQADQMLIHLREKGPLAAEIEVHENFFFYQSGIYSGEAACNGERRNHAVLIVGYGKDAETGKLYWIVKNSWGQLWGNKGYAKIERGSNVCGLEIHVRYPTIPFHE